jgi:hypothetical protein
MVDPATLPDILPSSSKKEDEGERRIELSEIIGLPDFDVCPSLFLLLLLPPLLIYIPRSCFYRSRDPFDYSEDLVKEGKVEYEAE